MSSELATLHSRPPYSALLATLNSLQLDPPSFEGASSQYAVSRFDALEVSNYLTSIISSPLGWLNDSERDDVWDAASRRLSERAGRSAQPSHDRTLTIPYPHPNHSISITLHEPTLTADRLGHKTWAAGYLLAKRIPVLRNDVPSLSSSAPSLILELGSGTGLVGLALAHYMDSARLHLTDLPDIVPNLACNVERNLSQLREETSSQIDICVFPLDWREIPALSGTSYTCARTESVVKDARPGAYEVVIAADVLYGKEHPPLVANAAACFLQKSERARIVIEAPRRERDGTLVDDLQMEMRARDLELVAQGEEEGWEEMGRDEGRVLCWWGIWRWRR